MSVETPNRNARRVFAVRLSPDEENDLHRAAEIEGVPSSVYLRDAGVQKARRTLKKAQRDLKQAA